jgi:uncharacterized protein (TIGR02996 family)
MKEDQQFLEAIRANPRDEALRLVYADWLEDRGDPRAEYLRLCDQLRRVQVRLAILSQQFDPAWLTVVGGCDEAAFHELRGILEAFNWIHSGFDRQYNRDLEVLPKPGTAQEAIQQWAEGWTSQVAISPLPEWEQRLPDLLRPWFVVHEIPLQHRGSLAAIYRRIVGWTAPAAPRQHPTYLSAIAQKIVELTAPIAVWRVEAQPIEGEEAIWEDLAFEQTDRIYLLHLGAFD